MFPVTYAVIARRALLTRSPRSWWAYVARVCLASGLGSSGETRQTRYDTVTREETSFANV